MPYNGHGGKDVVWQHHATILNAIMIVTTQAIADTGATSVFIMEGTDVDNKCIAKDPLTINLPNGKKVVSTHVSDTNILGPPMMLTGHTVPSLKVTLLLGIRPLCKAGCKVVFDNETCEEIFNNKVILTRYKDPSTDLWTLPLPTWRMWATPTSDAVTTTPTLPQPGPCIDCAPHPPDGPSDTHPGVNMAAFTHSVQTQTNAVKFAHQSLCRPKIFSLLKAVQQGFPKGCPNMKETIYS